MQSRKLIIRTYGGVMSANRFPDETFDSKLHKSVSEKRRIATRARQLVHDGDSISLGSGTTVYALSNLLDDMDSATIYTNSMQAADFLAHCASLDVHICGGIIRSSTGTIIGNEAYNFFNGICVDYAFISCNRAHAGLTTNGKFANHNGEADQYRKNEVNEQEGEAAAHTHLVREAPNVAQTDCRTDSGHQETKVGAKRSAIVFHNFLSFK